MELITLALGRQSWEGQHKLMPARTVEPDLAKERRKETMKSDTVICGEVFLITSVPSPESLTWGLLTALSALSLLSG